MAEKITRKDLFARIKDAMAEDPEVVAMCEKYIEQLSKPRKPRENKESIAFAEAVYNQMVEYGEPVTNKEMAAFMTEVTGTEVKPQKTSYAFKRLVDAGRVVRTEGEKKSDPAVFTIA